MMNLLEGFAGGLGRVVWKLGKYVLAAIVLLYALLLVTAGW